MWSVDSREKNEIVAAKYHILKLYRTEINFGWDATEKDHRATPGLLAGF